MGYAIDLLRFLTCMWIQALIVFEWSYQWIVFKMSSVNCHPSKSQLMSRLLNWTLIIPLFSYFFIKSYGNLPKKGSRYLTWCDFSHTEYEIFSVIKIVSEYFAIWSFFALKSLLHQITLVDSIFNIQPKSFTFCQWNGRYK